MVIRPIPRLIFLPVLLLGTAPIGFGRLSACCEVPPAVGSPAKTRVVWPSPPEQARVAYAASLSSERDIGRRASGFARLRQMLAGTQENVMFVQRPLDVAVDRASRVYISDGSRRQVLVFDPQARAARTLGVTGPGRLIKPMGIGLDNHSNIYVADQGGKRVVAFSAEGTFIRAYGSDAIFINPVDVAVDTTAGIVYVADSYLHEVLAFRQRDAQLLHRIGRHAGDVTAKQRLSGPMVAAHRSGDGDSVIQTGAADSVARAGKSKGSNDADSAMRAVVGHASNYTSEPRDIVANRGTGPGEFRYPSFLAVAPDGTVYVSDALNFRVQAFDRAGRYLRQVGQLGDGPGAFARPKGIGVDSEGHLYVADAAFNNVQIFDEKGRVLMQFGNLGRGAGEMWLPLGLFVDQNDRIYVADRYNNRVQIFEYLRSAGTTNGSNGSTRSSGEPRE